MQSSGFPSEGIAPLDLPHEYSRGEPTAPQRLGSDGELDSRPPCRHLERAGRTGRLPVPGARCQPRHGPAGRGCADPIPGHARRPSRRRRPRDRRGPRRPRSRSRSEHLPAHPPAWTDRRAAGSRSNSSKRGWRCTASPLADRGREREHEHLTEHREKDGLTRSCIHTRHVSPNQSHRPCDYERRAPDGSTRPDLRSEGRTRTRA